MSVAHSYAIKTILKAIGLNADEIENKAVEIQKVFLEFDINELRAAMQLVLDYKNNQAQIELRLIAIMNHLSIADPVLINQMAIKEEDNGRTDDSRTGKPEIERFRSLQADREFDPRN